MNVKEIMTEKEKVIFVAPISKVFEVARILIEHSFNGIPVVEDDVVVGLITEGDLLASGTVLQNYSELISKFIPGQTGFKKSDEKKDEMDTVLDMEVKNIMNKSFISVNPETSIKELMKILTEKNINPIPVVDKNKKLQGIVSRADIIKFVARNNAL